MAAPTTTRLLRPLNRPSVLPSSLTCRNLVSRRSLISPPTSTDGPLMERRSDRALPNVGPSSRRWLKTLPIFLIIVGGSTLAIFNYQKSSSSIVNSTLYALRVNPTARELLGDEIYFRDKIPWISGEMNQLHGRINIGFGVKGNKSSGYMRFKSVRRSRMGYFETQEWSLETEDGKVIQLLSNNDPFTNTALQAEPKKEI